MEIVHVYGDPPEWTRYIHGLLVQGISSSQTHLDDGTSKYDIIIYPMDRNWPAIEKAASVLFEYKK